MGNDNTYRQLYLRRLFDENNRIDSIIANMLYKILTSKGVTYKKKKEYSSGVSAKDFNDEISGLVNAVIGDSGIVCSGTTKNTSSLLFNIENMDEYRLFVPEKINGEKYNNISEAIITLSRPVRISYKGEEHNSTESLLRSVFSIMDEYTDEYDDIEIGNLIYHIGSHTLDTLLCMQNRTLFAGAIADAIGVASNELQRMKKYVDKCNDTASSLMYYRSIFSMDPDMIKMVNKELGDKRVDISTILRHAQYFSGNRDLKEMIAKRIASSITDKNKQDYIYSSSEFYISPGDIERLNMINVPIDIPEEMRF